MQGSSRHHEGKKSSCARLLATAALAATLGLGLAGQGLAQQVAGVNAQALKQACMADYKALCAGVQPGGGRILACLKQNADKLSPACKQALSDAKAARQQALGAAQ